MRQHKTFAQKHGQRGLVLDGEINDFIKESHAVPRPGFFSSAARSPRPRGFIRGESRLKLPKPFSLLLRRHQVRKDAGIAATAGRRDAARACPPGRRVLDRPRALRGPGESYSDVILRLAKG
jgi:hypothetical protein